VERQTDSQYDDDLTVGIADYDDEFIDAGYVDLFEYSGEEESPIARLKTIVLSIDWEITDEVLTQFNDELTDLQDIWADDPVKLVYVQALQKIGKYIFQQKSDSHPSAIKLLLTFYYNLEKIVLDNESSEAEKKEILRSDVKKFEQLKRQIEAETAKSKKPVASPAGVASLSLSEHGAAHPILFNLKACILGMDWEITERELSDLSKEIRRLEVEFAGDKPRLLFLQGIEALGGYIRLKKSNAHADAFKLLYSFYEGLEKIVVNDMSIEEQKAILFPEVEKFEQFKKIVLPSLIGEAPVDEETAGAVDDYEVGDEAGIAPAFADVPDEVHGFQADEEAAQLGDDMPIDVEDRLEQFFTEAGVKEQPAAEDTPVSAGPEDSFTQEAAQRVASFFDTEESRAGSSYMSVNPEDALRGVDVETDADDDSDEEALPMESDGNLAPALADMEGEPAPVFGDSSGEAIAWSDDDSVHEVEKRLGGFFDQEAEEGLVSQVAADSALRGVDVESEADDDTEEAALPLAEDEDLAPALFMEGEERGDGWPDEEEKVGSDIEDRLETLFAEDDAVVSSALEGVELDADHDAGPARQPVASFDDESPARFESEESIELEDQLDSFFGDSDDQDDRVDTAGLTETAAVEDQVTALFEPADDVAVAPVDLAPGGPIDDDDETDRVVFTPVEDEEEIGGEIAEGVIDDGGDDDDDEDGYATFASESDEAEFFAAIDDRVDEPGEFQMELLDETDDLDTRDVASLTEPGIESIDRLGEEPPAPAFMGEPEEEEDEEDTFVFASDDDLGDLRGAIASLGVEISEPIIQGILSAVNGLRHHYANRPVEKTFLQLISTIVQHIGQYRYEASAEAHGLLLSVFDKLELIQNPEMPVEQIHEILLAETSKVLLWQQTMLDRQAIRKGDELTFLSPVRSDQVEMDDDEPADDVTEARAPFAEEESAAEEFQAVFEPVEDEDEQAGPISAGEYGDDDDIFGLADDEQPEQRGFPDDSPVPDEEAPFSLDAAAEEEADDSVFLSFDEEPEETKDETAPGQQPLSLDDTMGPAIDDVEAPSPDELEAAGGDRDPVTEYVKKELAALRTSLRAEIEELRKRLESKD
jgi:pilus assembly protein FimV